MHKWAICSIAMLTGESVGNHLNWINQPVTGPTLCQLSVPSNRPITLPRGANGASHANQYTLRVIFNLSWCERYIYVVLSLSLHTACIHVYQILYILITKKLPTHISIRIHIYIYNIHIVHDRWYSKWPRSTDPANYCRYRKPTVCRSFSLQMCLPYLWQFNYGNLLDNKGPSCQRFPTVPPGK